MNPPKHMIYEWSHSQLIEKRQQLPVEKESPEMMIRALKSIFCKGRYRSWRFQENRKSKTKRWPMGMPPQEESVA